ncbi:hypothetical protein Tco_0615810 [Tanacetum coccineum]
MWFRGRADSETSAKRSLLKKLSNPGWNKVLDEENSEDNFSCGSALEDYITLLFVLVRNIIPYDTSDPANRFCPDGEETVTLEKESRSKLDKDTVKPYNYTYQNSLYETFKPPSKAYLDQLERA